VVVVHQNNNQVSSDGVMGQPQLRYSDAGSGLKDNNTSLLVHTASISAKKEKMGDTAFVLKQTIHLILYFQA